MIPVEIWPYVMANLYYKGICTCSAIVEIFQEYSHDRLTRMLKGDWSGQTLFEWALKLLFTVVGGHLKLDDTVMEKPYSKKFYEAAYMYSNKEQKIVFGISLVLLVWSNGIFNIPIAFRVWKKGGTSRIELALELLSYARNRLKVKPDYVFFDSFFSSKSILKRLKDYGWYYVTQVKKNRKFNGLALKFYRKHPYWNEIGSLEGSLKVHLVRHRKKYYISNRLSLSAQEIRSLYKKRWSIEEIFRFLKSELNLEGCQAGVKREREKSSKAEGVQEHHIALCLLSYLVLERERQARSLTLRQLKRKLILKRQQVSLPFLERLKASA